MTNEREFVEKPVVSLDAEKLLGVRRLAKVAEKVAGANGSDVSPADMSRLLSKTGVETTLAK